MVGVAECPALKYMPKHVSPAFGLSLCGPFLESFSFGPAVLVIKRWSIPLTSTLESRDVAAKILHIWRSVGPKFLNLFRAFNSYLEPLLRGVLRLVYRGILGIRSVCTFYTVL